MQMTYGELVVVLRIKTSRFQMVRSSWIDRFNHPPTSDGRNRMRTIGDWTGPRTDQLGLDQLRRQ